MAVGAQQPDLKGLSKRCGAKLEKFSFFDRECKADGARRLRYSATVMQLLDGNISNVAVPYIFLVQFFPAPKPFLSPIFSDTNFLIGIVLMFVIGVNMYATLALLAPFLPELMSYPVLTAGFILAPRDVGVILATFVTGG